MKELIIRNLKKIVPTVVMFLVSLVVLEVFMAIGIISGRASLVSTVIEMFVVVMLLMAVLLIGTAGKAFLEGLKQKEFYGIWAAKGFNRGTLLGGLTGIYTVAFLIPFLCYVVMLVLDIFWISNAFPNEREGLEGIRLLLFPDKQTLPMVLASVVEYILISASFIALVFLCSAWAYNIFTRGRYSGLMTALIVISVGVFMIKLNLMFTSSLDGYTEHLASAGIQAGFTALFLVLTHQSVAKHNWNT